MIKTNLQYGSYIFWTKPPLFNTSHGHTISLNVGPLSHSTVSILVLIQLTKKSDGSFCDRRIVKL